MVDRIFFKDKSDTVKGPFTERQVQEWYRQKWFDGAFPFYFAHSDEVPSELDTNWLTLDSLLSRNGVGCPFIKFDNNEKSEFEKNRQEREEKLEKIEKEIAGLQQHCTTTLSLEKAIQRAERQLEELSTQETPKKMSSKKIPTEAEIEGATEEELYKLVMDNVEEMGIRVFEYVENTLNVYCDGDFAGWTEQLKELERNLPPDSIRHLGHFEGLHSGLERVLVEKLKKRDMGDHDHCSLCNQNLFNYKQTLMHFYSTSHRKKETEAVKESNICSFRTLLDAFTKLPETLRAHDLKTELDRFSRNGGLVDMNRLGLLRPTHDFMKKLYPKYHRLMKASADEHVNPLDTLRGEVGREALAEWDAHIGQSPTFCSTCKRHTGDREGLYAHLVSYVHIEAIAQSKEPLDFLTMTVNMQRRDLI